MTATSRSKARPLRIALAILAALLLAAFTGWGALAIRYAAPVGDATRQNVSLVFAGLGLVAVAGIFARPLRWLTAAFLALGAAVLVWFLRIEPSNERDWQPEVARLAYADVQGDEVTIHNIRNFDYRSETDFTPQYYDKTFDLRKLDTVDMIGSYWMGDAIAHMMVSFGFAGQDYLTVSIETRKEIGESYSTLAGFFRQYELFYVVADERDLIRVRTNYRKDPPEDVYVYRTTAPPENVRRLFLSYIDEINSLRTKPEFYNTMTTNCTTNIWTHTKVNNATPFSWKILASGYVPSLLYDRGKVDTRLPFEELRRRAHVNAAAQAADTAPDFSQRIRATVPMPGK